VLEQEQTVLFTNPVATTTVGAVSPAAIPGDLMMGRVDSILGATFIKYDLASTGREVYQAGASFTSNLLSREEIADRLLIADVMRRGCRLVLGRCWVVVEVQLRGMRSERGGRGIGTTFFVVRF
jgi:hypothetical protein